MFFDETGGVGIAFSKQAFDHLIFTGSGTTGRAVMAASSPCCRERLSTIKTTAWRRTSWSMPPPTRC